VGPGGGVWGGGVGWEIGQQAASRGSRGVTTVTAVQLMGKRRPMGNGTTGGDRAGTKGTYLQCIFFTKTLPTNLRTIHK
jgi:hypothetical protein